MFINQISTKYVNSVNSSSINKKQVNFKGGEDTFVSTAASSFSDARKAILEKYRKPISNFRLRRKETCDFVRICTNMQLSTGESDVQKAILSLLKMDEKLVDSNTSSKIINFEERVKNLYYALTLPKTYKKSNCIMAVSKDKEMGETIFRYFEYLFKTLKMQISQSCSDDIVFGNCKGLSFLKKDELTKKELDLFSKILPLKLDFKVLDDVVPQNASVEDFYESLLNALTEAKSNYDKTGRSTILHVKNMEDFINSEKYSSSSFASLKDILPDVSDDFHTIITFTNTNTAQSESGILASHRVGYAFNIDELGINKTNIEKYIVPDKLRSIADNTCAQINQTSDLYADYSDKISKLQQRSRDEILELQKTAPKKKKSIQQVKRVKQVKPATQIKPPTQIKPVEQIKHIVDGGTTSIPNLQNQVSNQQSSTVQKLSKNKKIAFALGAVTLALTTVAVLYKKGILCKSKSPKQQLEQQKTNINFLKQSPYMSNNSSIFSSFIDYKG